MDPQQVCHASSMYVAMYVVLPHPRPMLKPTENLDLSRLGNEVMSSGYKNMWHGGNYENDTNQADFNIAALS